MERVGKIYKIVNDVNNRIYIGSTFSDLRKRLFEHKCFSKKVKYQSIKLYVAFTEIGFEHFDIKLVEEVKVKSKEEPR
jgi:predicted GIY-YIG superfamily endonuclease